METKKITLTQVNRYTTKKDGSTLMGSNGKPYTSVRIKCAEFGEQFLSGFGNKENAAWKSGDQVEVLVEKKEVGGKEYFNFSIPKKEEKMADEMNQLVTKVARLRFQMDIIWAAHLRTKTGATENTSIDEEMEYPEPTSEELNEAGIE